MAAQTSENLTKNLEECAILSTTDTSKLVSPRDLDSWKTLVKAAEIINHVGLMDLARRTPEWEWPQVLYHRKCMKKLLDVQVPKVQAEGSSARAARATLTRSRVLEEKCIFCDKASKYIKGQKTRENLIKCCELRADSEIRDSAIKKLDDRMLAITSMELVAAEGHYH